MKILVTGADGFVGSWLVPHLVEAGHAVIAAVRLGDASPDLLDRRARLTSAARIVELEMTSGESFASLASETFDGVIHLAAIASVALAGQDIPLTWDVNTTGTVRLAEHLASRAESGEGPRLLFVSTGEVYGRSPSVPRSENDPVQPVSSYAASKLAAEVGVMETGRRTGLPVIVARAFGHTGPGQAASYVVPAFAQRLVFAKRIGAPVVEVGNMEAVREFMHVSDVVRAYRLLLEGGEPGQTYNVASGAAVSLRELFLQLSDAVGHPAVPETDASLMRSVDIPYLVGDGGKIQRAVGWTPEIPLARTLAEVVDAQAH